MKLFVCMFGSQRRMFVTSTIVSTLTGVGIEFFAAPPVALFLVAYGMAALAMATKNWTRSHSDEF